MQEKKIFVCVYESGDGNLLENTKELLAYNLNNPTPRARLQNRAARNKAEAAVCRVHNLSIKPPYRSTEIRRFSYDEIRGYAAVPNLNMAANRVKVGLKSKALSSSFEKKPITVPFKEPY